MFLDAPGSPSSYDELRIPKAVALATYLRSGKHRHAQLLEIRRDTASGIETIVCELRIEISQIRINPILPTERIALSFYPGDDQPPEVLALRPDFPHVPHLNQRDSEFPRCLCLYELPYSTIKLRWTPTNFIERIRDWLSLSAEGKLHQGDQPLEQLFLGPIPPLIVPSHFLQAINTEPTENEQLAHFGIVALGTGPGEITGFAVSDLKMMGPQGVPPHLGTAILAPPQKHGAIRKTPKTLRDLADVMSELNVDLLEVLRQRIRHWHSKDGSITQARLLLILIFPKLREAGASAETLEWWGFLLLDNLKEIGAKLGVWEVTPNGTLAGLIGGGEERAQELAVQIVSPVTQLTRDQASLYNGIQADNRKFAIIGIGALGSMTLLNLARKGFGFWNLIDDDLFMPHNGARHALPAAASGVPKVAAFKHLADSLYEDSSVAAISRANVLGPGIKNTLLGSTLDGVDVIVDCSADVAVARFIALDLAGDARRLSLFLSPNGEQLVLLLEDRERLITLDALEMQFYRFLLDTEALNEHYGAESKRIRYGRSCRDLSAVLSADAISLFAGIGSRAIERLLSGDAAAIRVWKTQPDLSVATFQATPRKTFRTAVGPYTVVWDEGVVDKLRWLRGERLPKETGGALLGCWDLSRSILYVAHITGAPTDSVEKPTAFIRGSNDLSMWISQVSRLTGRAIEYVGEWHSHPDGYSTQPSKCDRQVFQWIEDHLSIDGIPALMLIVGKTGLRWISGTEGDGVAWTFPN